MKDFNLKEEYEETLGYDSDSNSRLFATTDVSFNNLNQGVFKDHFYFGKKIRIKDKWIDCVIFDNGNTAIDRSQIPNKKERMKLEAVGEFELDYPNQIKNMGIDYKFRLIPIDKRWSNESIYDFICLKKEKYKDYVDKNVGNVSNVDTYPQGKKEQGNVEMEVFEHTLYNTIPKIPSPPLVNPIPTLPTLLTQSELHLPTFFWNENENKKKQYFEIMKSIFSYYMDVQDERLFTLLPTYVIATFCFTLFDAMGYIFFNAERESGKTKCANIIEYLCYNPMNSTSPSESVIFRLIEQTKGTLFIDDFEKLPEEKKNTILQILKVGYKKGGSTARSEKVGDMYVPTFFDVYSPKVITNTTYLEYITLSRCIPIHFLKTTTDKGKLTPQEKMPYWSKLRDIGYVFILEYWKEIKDIYDNYENDSFNNRNLEIAKGLLSIARFIGDEYHDELEAYLLETFEQRDTYEYEGSKDYKLLYSMFKQLPKEEKKWVSPKKIAEWYVDEYPNDEKPFTPVWVGRHLKKIPIFKRKRTAGGSVFCLSQEIVFKYMTIRGYSIEGVDTDPDKEKMEVEKTDLADWERGDV